MSNVKLQFLRPYNCFDAAFLDKSNNPLFGQAIGLQIIPGSLSDDTVWLNLEDPWWLSKEELDYVKHEVICIP